MRIPIERRHVTEGRRGDMRKCPAALALRDAEPGNWTVTPFTVIRDDEDDLNREMYYVDDELAEMIDKYDNGTAPMPTGTLVLEDKKASFEDDE